jgi:dimeric dUTPase (all-alpha-NTP-PPase superfamily)
MVGSANTGEVHRQMDKLDKIFEMQCELNERIGVDCKNLNEREKIEWVLHYSRALQQEVSELVDSVPWKWWAKYLRFDEQNARVEIIDILHFLVSTAQILGMTSEDFFEAYCKKNHINHRRQDSGYAVKDESDSREI